MFSTYIASFTENENVVIVSVERLNWKFWVTALMPISVSVNDQRPILPFCWHCVDSIIVTILYICNLSEGFGDIKYLSDI